MPDFPQITAGPVLGLATLAAAAIFGEDPGTVRLFPLDPPADRGPAAIAILPGFSQGLRVRREKDIEGAPIEGRGGQVKLYHGMKDARIDIPLRLPDDRIPIPGGGGVSVDIPLIGGNSPEEKLAVIEQMFSRKAAGGGLMTYEITNEAINKMGVKRVVFGDLEMTAHKATDYLDVTAVFIQHDPDAEIARAMEETTPATVAPPETTETPRPADTSLLDEIVSWF